MEKKKTLAYRKPIKGNEDKGKICSLPNKYYCIDENDDHCTRNRPCEWQCEQI
jgi:hypothetical protein